MTITHTIDHDVPIPIVRSGRKPVLPWAGMQPGDSFLIPDNPDSKWFARVNFSAGRKAHPGSTWKSCRVSQHGGKGTRVWRMS